MIPWKKSEWFYTESDFLRKTQWFILWRLVFVSFFLFLTVFLQEKHEFSLSLFSFSRLYFWVALQYFFSILYILILLPGKAAPWMAVIQLLVDGLFVTAVVTITGGVESFFPYLYFLVIVAGGILFPRSGGILTALYVSLLYGLILFAQRWEIPPLYGGPSFPMIPYSVKYYWYHMIMHGVGFFLVGYLSSLFAEQTVKQWNQIENQKKNIDQLEELNKVIIENLDFGLMTLDYENNIQSVNPAGEKILGWTHEQLINQPLRKVFPELDEPLRPENPVIPNRLEIAYLKPQGPMIPIGCSFNPVAEDRTMGIGKILSFKDISKIKAMEEHLRQTDRLALMGKMAAGIAHEIRNPLASISGSIQVLMDDLKEEKTGERLLKIMAREVTRLDALVNSFLTFARPVQEYAARTDISELIQGTVELIKKNREVPSTITWVLDIAPNLIVDISLGELSQMLWNILINAVQAVPPTGHISIEARNSRRGSTLDWIEITIRDDGAGITEQDRIKIFDPFYTTKEQGIGLGLSIVQKIIAHHGGEIRLDPSENKGAKFILLLPGAGDRTLTKTRPLG
jgi:two-component system, NtrC family, sensor histidine kinase PilS